MSDARPPGISPLFASARGLVAVELPFALDDVIASWAGLRRVMARLRPDAFERDEWAYLISFLDADNLRLPFRSAFGEPREAGAPAWVARPGGPVAVWLPNNVSLLGPLILVLLSLTGCPLRCKAGSRAKNLSGAFLDFVLAHLPSGPLRAHLENHVRVEVFDRTDARNADWAATARVRIVFGSDQAAEAVHKEAALGLGFSFIDRQSEAWVEATVGQAELDALAKVFAIYGQAGCTSPRRVVVIDGSMDDARRLRDRLLERWSRLFPRPPAPHVASAGILARQWAAALGWEARATTHHHAVLALGDYRLPTVAADRILTLSPAALAEAVSGLPPNIQTVGYAASPRTLDGSWRPALAGAPLKRLVPVPEMHHFGPVWDGEAYWQACFEQAPAGS